MWEAHISTIDGPSECDGIARGLDGVHDDLNHHRFGGVCCLQQKGVISLGLSFFRSEGV
jgi:hypothetical protein